jgi:putative transposase
MIITKTYKYKLYRNKKNKHLHQQINIAGIIYNHCIALHKRYYRIYGKHLNCYHLQKHITKLKKHPRHAFWNLVGSQAIQNICQRIDKAYKLFSRNLKHSIKTAPPGFKKVKKYKSFTLKQAGWKLLDGNKIQLNSHVYKYAKSRDIEGTIKTVTVKRDTLNNLYLCFSVKQEIEIPDTRDNSRVCGFDFGLKTFLVLSNGSDIKNPLFFKQSQKDIKHANRDLSRKQKGSNHYKHAKRTLAKVHETVKNRRRDYQFKLANQLTDDYDVLIFETLNIKGMQRLWGKKVNDLGFASFLLILKHVAIPKGKIVFFLDQWQPTTKPCSACGYLNYGLTLNDRYWTCPQCSTFHNRDKNASINIERQGVVALGLGGVRPPLGEATAV